MSDVQITVGIRRRRDADLDDVVEVLHRVQAATGYPVQMPADPHRWLASSRTTASWVATLAGGTIVGQVSRASVSGDFAGDTWTAALGCTPDELAVVKRLFVDPSVAGKGIGRRLLDTVVADVHRDGLVPVLDVDAGSLGARALYERAGFRSVGQLELTWTGLVGTFLAECYVGPRPRSG